MTKYEHFINEMEDYVDVGNEDTPSMEAMEAAGEAMAFVKALNDLFRDNGADLPEEPDCSLLENMVDALHGELAAACLFLAEKSFARVPDMLRVIESQVVGQEDVPVVMQKAYGRLATRIENTRKTLKAFKADSGSDPSKTP